MLKQYNLKPKRVFYYFEQLSKIPHGSGNCKKISEYCINFAKEKGFKYYTDSFYNVIIKKDASRGYEGKPPVILQGHLDMVCEKENDITFNFLTDPLNLKVEGDVISAQGTTLGGDDGIAVAMILSILEDNTLSHPPIEAVFTTDEETGMFGAEGLDTSKLNGKRLINIDSENEGVLTVSCAGGARVDIEIPLEKERGENAFYEITVDGLMGGHSGVEIHKPRLNANKILGLFLKTLPSYQIALIEGGLKDNAIPRSARAVISSKENPLAFIENFLNQNDFKETPVIKSKNTEFDGEVFTYKCSAKITDFLCEVKNGVVAFSKDIKGLVETSLNLGIMNSSDKEFKAAFSVRSSVSSEKQKLLNVLENTALKYGGKFTSHSHYPPWEYRKNSLLRDTMTAVYEKMYGKKMVVEAIHAGLECGLFSDKIKDLDAVSFGPDMFDIHTPKERLSISSVDRSYQYLCEVLRSM